MERIVILTLACLVAAFAYGSERNLRFVKKFQFPGSAEVVVVAEGDFEPRGSGIRVYGGTSKKFPTDDFVLGLVRPRNGIVEAVRFDERKRTQRI
jgi:Periplasmic lysozyme inhibitor of I-type lysozyme